VISTPLYCPCVCNTWKTLPSDIKARETQHLELTVSLVNILLKIREKEYRSDDAISLRREALVGRIHRVLKKLQSVMDQENFKDSGYSSHQSQIVGIPSIVLTSLQTPLVVPISASSSAISRENLPIPFLMKARLNRNPPSKHRVTPASTDVGLVVLTARERGTVYILIRPMRNSNRGMIAKDQNLPRPLDGQKSRLLRQRRSIEISINSPTPALMALGLNSAMQRTYLPISCAIMTIEICSEVPPTGSETLMSRNPMTILKNISLKTIFPPGKVPPLSKAPPTSRPQLRGLRSSELS
jgi:hypothetical protein